MAAEPGGDGARAERTRELLASAPTRTPAGDGLSELAVRVFRLNGLLLAASDRIAGPSGLTSAWWQVLGAVLRGPLPVAEIARAMGLARQSVQRVADVVVREGLAVYRPNPAHRRAKLLDLTPRGREALASLRARQHAWADRIGAELGEAGLRRANEVIDRLAAALEADRPEGKARRRAGRSRGPEAGGEG